MLRRSIVAAASALLVYAGIVDYRLNHALIGGHVLDQRGDRIEVLGEPEVLVLRQQGTLDFRGRADRQRAQQNVDVVVPPCVDPGILADVRQEARRRRIGKSC